MNGKLGRLPTRLDRRTVQAADLMQAAGSRLPAAPLARNWTRLRRADGSPGNPIEFATFSNLSYGDCTCAAFGHLDQAVCAATGNERTVDVDMVLRAYDEISDWDRSAPELNDHGAHNLDALRWFRAQGLLVAYAAVSSRSHVKVAVNVCHGVYVGADLPLSAQRQLTWDVAPAGSADQDYRPRSWGGHAMMLLGYDTWGVWFATWGRRQYASWSWYDVYVREAYVVVHRALVDQPNKLSPAGYLREQILANLSAFKG